MSRQQNTIAAALFLAPTVALIIVLRLLPAAEAIMNSMMQGIAGSIRPPTFVGLDVFAKVLQSKQFWFTVRQTLIFNVIVNPLQILLALLLAVLLSQKLPAVGLWRTAVFLPAAIPLAGSSVIWGIALRPDGPVNGLLGLLHLAPQPFFTSPDQVIASMILLTSWIGVGYWMMFLIAGLNDIPKVYYEAAKIDGAGPIRTFFAITIPMLRRPLLFVLVADTVANFILFAPVQILTKGGPQKHSNFLMYDVFHKSFELSDIYTASAELVLLLALIIGIVAIQFRLLGQGEADT
ncbi:hypothetical protein N185_16505 [Sinorhizobium sp. GW3]|nr:hypothetical protein N185_16505 [Sinorhizobium sp. GW3]